MSYLTKKEYEEFGFSEIDDSVFDQLITKASAVLDSVTRGFYNFNELEKDIDFRKNKFKKALCAQIEYFNELGATTSESINVTPVNFSAGRTSVSNASSNRSNENKSRKSIVADEVHMHLNGTGLLYRGVATC